MSRNSKAYDQEFKENVINPLIMWLFGEDITKIKDKVNTKEFENKLKERLTSLLFDYNNKSVIEDTIIFNDLIIAFTLVLPVSLFLLLYTLEICKPYGFQREHPFFTIINLL